MKPVGTGALFENQGHRLFTEITGRRYDDMARRIEKKKLPPLTFTKGEFRAHVLAALNGNEDGAIQCRYCRKFCTIKEVSPDHEKPLSRGGSTDLHNIGFPCMNCNQAKGSMTPMEFLKLRAFLECEIPEARIDVLGRLARSNKLARTATHMRGMLARLNEKNAKKQDDLEPF
jgi:hypothetical protein